MSPCVVDKIKSNTVHKMLHRLVDNTRRHVGMTFDSCVGLKSIFCTRITRENSSDGSCNSFKEPKIFFNKVFTPEESGKVASLMTGEVVSAQRGKEKKYCGAKMGRLTVRNFPVSPSAAVERQLTDFPPAGAPTAGCECTTNAQTHFFCFSKILKSLLRSM